MIKGKSWNFIIPKLTSHFRTSMGEDVTEWIFEYVSAEEDTDTEAEEADSSGESEKDWHILREVAEDRY